MIAAAHIHTTKILQVKNQLTFAFFRSGFYQRSFLFMNPNRCCFYREKRYAESAPNKLICFGERQKTLWIVAWLSSQWCQKEKWKYNWSACVAGIFHEGPKFFSSFYIVIGSWQKKKNLKSALLVWSENWNVAQKKKRRRRENPQILPSNFAVVMFFIL